MPNTSSELREAGIYRLPDSAHIDISTAADSALEQRTLVAKLAQVRAAGLFSNHVPI